MEVETSSGKITISDDELIYDDKIRILTMTITEQQETIQRQECEIKRLSHPVSKKVKAIGILSLVFTMLGSPTVAIFVKSIIGWILYSISAIMAMIYAKKRCDIPIFWQFMWYLGWDVIAIIARVW
jgi:hypothetical protein